ncbi:MAG: hypothetical protein WCY62_04260 [Clostridia bacterium]
MKKKICLPMVFLNITALVIILAGVAFGIHSLVNDVSFTVLGTQIHGAVFAGVIAFLGIRYLISALKLMAEVKKTGKGFSWSNFKKDRQDKFIKAEK